MSKSTVTKLFIGSGIAIVAGSILAIAAIWFAIANDLFVMNGSDIVGLRGGPLAWSVIGPGLFGGLAIVAGFLGGIVSWIGALVNTWRLDRKGWFVGLFLLGVFNLGFFAMVAYLLGGPDASDDTTARARQVPAGAVSG
jgi:hypothetical protein